MDLRERGRRVLDRCRDAIGPRFAEPQTAELGRRKQQQLEAGLVAILQSENDLLGDFVRRDDTPGIDPAVLVLVDPPARAGRVEPAVFVGLAVEVRIDVAIDLEATREVAPLVDDVVAVGIGKPPQDFALPVADDPRRDVVLLLRPDRALGRFLFGRSRVFHERLDRRQRQRLRGRRGLGSSGGLRPRSTMAVARRKTVAGVRRRRIHPWNLAGKVWSISYCCRHGAGEKWFAAARGRQTQV